MEFLNAFIRHPGSVAGNRLMLMRRSRTILDRNAEDLMQVFDALADEEHVERLLLDPTSSSDESYAIEIHRLWQNFSTAAIAAADHIRRFSRFESSEFQQRYQAQVDEVKDQPVVAFTRRLRNHVLHQGFPFVQAKVRFDHSGRVHGSVAVDCELLLKDGDWSEPARAYIVGMYPSLRLEQSVVEYLGIINPHFDELLAAYEDEHADDLDDLDKLQARWDAESSPDAIKFGDLSWRSAPPHN